MTVRADYVVKVRAIFADSSEITTVLPGLTDVEYRLLRSLELKLNLAAGYPLLKFYQVKGGETVERLNDSSSV